MSTRHAPAVWECDHARTKATDACLDIRSRLEIVHDETSMVAIWAKCWLMRRNTGDSGG